MGKIHLSALVLAFFQFSVAHAQVPVAGHSSKLVLDEPIQVGPGQTLSGRGAPVRRGVYVELWRVPPGSVQAESVSCVEVDVSRGGDFFFHNVDVASGESYYVTLSRSWHFDTPGDHEGWVQRQNDLSSWEVSGGTLKLTVDDVNGDRIWDPFIVNLFTHDTSIYRVVEIRMRNPAPNPGATTLVALFWSWSEPNDQMQAYRLKDIPKAMIDFETFLFPMNVGERCLSNGEVSDGLWFSEYRPCDGSPAAPNAPNNALRIDPINGFQSPELAGIVVEIDSIRLREDYRLDFHTDGDPTGIASFNAIEPSVTLAGGFLTYTSPGDPSLGFDFGGPNTEYFETGYFSRFLIGFDNQTLTTETGSAGLRFGGGTEALFPVSLGGRQDLSALFDSMTDPTGAWSAASGVDLQGLELLLPEQPSDGTPVRLDYIGLTTAEPFGPSEVVRAANVAPVAIAVCEALAPVGGQARLRLDGSESHDLDGDPLTFQWRIDGSVVCGGPREECAAIEVSLDFGTHTVELRVTDPEGAFGEASKTVTFEPGALATLSIEDAEVDWGDVPHTLEVSGEIGLPPGLDSTEVTPIATISADVALLEVLPPTDVTFTVHGAGPKKRWRFRDERYRDGDDDDGGWTGGYLGLRKFDIDWKGARYRLKDESLPFSLRSRVITSSETVLSMKLKPKRMDGPFTIDFGGLASVDVGLDGSITASPTVGVDIEKPGRKATITLPFPLLVTTVITVTGSVDRVILVADDLRESIGRFRGEIHFDGDFPDRAQTTPRTLGLQVSIGDQGLFGSDTVGPDELTVDDDEWELERDDDD